MNDKRKMLVLAAVVDEYIKSGEPVGSGLVQKCMSLDVSSATVRNDMASLERDGFLEQPHTSAGRIPTYLGYRCYIDKLMTPTPLTAREKRLIDSMLGSAQLQTANAVLENAVDVMADLTQLTVATRSNIPMFSIITQVQVIPAGRRLYALLIITSAGTIKNKICRFEFDLTYDQLDYFSQFVKKNLTGINVDELTSAMLENLAATLGSYMMALSPLLHAVYELSDEMCHCGISLTGEQRLLLSGGLKPDEVLSLLSHKNQLESLLSSAFDGISVVFGKENNCFAITNSSMIVSPYKIAGENGGSFGVIGPVRVDYAKVIPHVEYISNSVTKLLSNVIESEEKRNEQKKI